MKASEAFNAIYSHAERMGLDEFGICAVAKVQAKFPKYEVMNEAFLAQAITPEQYASRCIAILNEYAFALISERLTKLLLEVEHANQVS